MTEADKKVLALVTRYARQDADNLHLRECPQLSVAYPRAWDGEYGCDTGCEYARLEAILTCPHGETENFEYGTFGEIAWLLEDLERND